MVFSNFFQGLSDAFSVNRPVTSSSSFGADEDTLKTTNALKGLGHINDHKPDISAGLKSFQADQGLKVDGIMNPGGPTENALSQTLAQNGIGNSDLLAKKQDPLQPEIKVTKPISSQPDAPSFTASAPFGPPAHAKKPQTALIPEGNTVDERIRSLMADPLYSKKQEKPIVDHVVKQFERSYPGEVQYDETGKMIQPTPVIKPEEVEPFDLEGELQRKQRQTQHVQNTSHDLSETNLTDKEAMRNSESNNFQQYRENLSEKEGGYVDDPRDDGGPTNKGVSQRYLDQLRKDPDWAHLPDTTKELSNDQIDRIFKDRFYTKPKIEKLEKIPGLEDASPQLADQIYDAGVLHGTPRAGRWLQEALLEVTGVDLREIDPQSGQKYFDGNIGPKTREAVKNAISSGQIKNINNLIVQKRLELMRIDDDYETYKNGWEDRAQSFLQN